MKMKQMRKSSPRRRGVILIAVTWMLIILTGLAIVLSFTMRVEVEVSGNALSQAQADAIELGAEQYVITQVDPINPAFLGDPTSILNNVNCENVPVGTGYFWIMRSNIDNPADTDYDDDFGITDECGKININNATATQLGNLPGMTNGSNSAIPASIVAWRGNGKIATAGSTSVAASTSQDGTYYATFPDPYIVKNAGFESVDELTMVSGIVLDPSALPGSTSVSLDPLYGSDFNHNGILDASEMNGAGGNQLSADQPGCIGFAPCVTVWSNEPNVAYDGTALVNVNTGSTSAMTTALQNGLSGSRVQAVIQATQRGKPFRSLLDYYAASTMTITEFSSVSGYLTTAATTTTTTATSGTTTSTPGTPGLVNVCTAPAAVLACLPGLSADDAQTLISARQSASDLTNVAWVSAALGAAKASLIGPSITARSFQYSADIIAVSADGRSFKRVKIVVDTSGTPNSPPKIVYRKDLTTLGWPLDPGIRDHLSKGEKLQTSISKPSMKGGT